jgi:hypothetical protein
MISLMSSSSLIGSLLILASAKVSESPEESATHTTGVREPDARIKNVSLSLLSAGIERPRRTRSKSPSLKCAMASLIDPADVTKHPADCQTEL